MSLVGVLSCVQYLVQRLFLQEVMLVLYVWVLLLTMPLVDIGVMYAMLTCVYHGWVGVIDYRIHLVLIVLEQYLFWFHVESRGGTLMSSHRLSIPWPSRLLAS